MTYIEKPRKIRVAFVKFGGMAVGGTEKYLQNIAAYLPKSLFEVDYFYCNAAPYIGSDWKHPDTSQERLEFVKKRGVNVIEFYVGAKDVTKPTHPWVGTNFFEDVFDESKYDIIQTGRAGHPEYPFTEIKKTPIVDSIHLSGMVDNQENIAKVIHISNMNAETWVKAGGNRNKVEVIYPPIIPPEDLLLELRGTAPNMRSELGIADDVVVYGLHQRDNEEIFSEWPLGAYAAVERNHGDKVCFVLLGGAKKHREQAKQLGLKNFHALDATGDQATVWKFLRTLNVYVHGRKDGEINSQALAEAMYCGLPIVSHISANNNGHVETIGDAGVVCDRFEKYSQACNALFLNEELRKEISEKSKARFKEAYDLKTNIQKIVDIYQKIVSESEVDKLSDDEFWESMF